MLHFDHADVLFALVVGERDAGIEQEGEDAKVVVLEAAEEVGGFVLFGAALPGKSSGMTGSSLAQGVEGTGASTPQGKRALTLNPEIGQRLTSAWCSVTSRRMGQMRHAHPRQDHFFVAAGLLWIIMMGWIIHLWAIIDAALWKGKP